MTERSAPARSALDYTGSESSCVPLPDRWQTYLPQPGVVVRAVSSELVILDLNEGLYYTLNGVGSSIWHHLEQGHHVADIVDALIDEYEIQPEEAYRDTMSLVEELMIHKLVQRQSTR